MKRNDTLRLHPDQYVKLDEPLVMYFGSSIAETDFDLLKDTLSKRKTPVVIAGSMNKKKNDYQYDLELPSFSVRMYEPPSGDQNLLCAAFQKPENKVNKFYNDPHKKMFLVEAAKGYLMVYNKTPGISNSAKVFLVDPKAPTPVTEPEYANWNMDGDVYQELMRKMRRYFSDKETGNAARVSDAMNDQVMIPFNAYTQGEYDYEERKVDFTKALKYESREVGTVASGKKATYLFFSRDTKYDPEDPVFVPGNRLSIYREDQISCGISGLLVGVDVDSRDGVLFILECYQQFDLERLPETGYLFITPNDTQLKIRRKVAKSIRYGEVKANYMYRLFDDFYVEDYDPLSKHPDLIPFLEKRLADKFPPNQMQLEAIVKGVLTEDVLLVLGPPGTGKTTVILSWVDYLVSQKKRVLISSQNNSAVDNVLERCDTKYEIVRLGRSDKVQENCRRFLPENRIASMRSACEENCRQLEEQLQKDRLRIDGYLLALQVQQELLVEQKQLEFRLEEAKKNFAQLGETIRKSYESNQKALETLYQSRSKAERYQIFIEESNRRNVIIRWLQKGLRKLAQKKIDACGSEIQKAESQLQYTNLVYNQSVVQLKEALARLREEGILSRLQEIRKKTRDGNLQIRHLMPVLGSDLGSLKLLEERPQFSDVPMDNLNLIFAEQLLMKQVLEAADKIQAAAKAWSDAVHRDERNDIFQEILLETCQVVGATCVGINSNKTFANVDFDVTIIDESGQIQLHNALIPMSRSPKTLMLGDYKQIPPIVNDEILATLKLDQTPTELYEQSFFQYLFEQLRLREIRRLAKKPALMGMEEDSLPEEEKEREQLLKELARKKILEPMAEGYIGQPLEEENPADPNKPIYHCRYTPEQLQEFVGMITGDRKKLVNLNSQFRMPGHISNVISQWFYEKNYKSSYDMKRFVPVVPGTDKPMVIIDTGDRADRYESQPESKMGYHNELEAKVVAQVLGAVLAGMSEQERSKYAEELDKGLGIISAYGAQVRMIRQTLRKELGLTQAQVETAVASLDSFQGQERDLIIYSLTRSDSKSRKAARVGFLKELRRLNVAFTRCKKQLVIIGDLKYLQECLYVEKTEQELPCAETVDDLIEDSHILQCAECSLDCERRFARFFRLLLQHATDEEHPAGNVYTVGKFQEILKGGEDDGT